MSPRWDAARPSSRAWQRRAIAAVAALLWVWTYPWFALADDPSHPDAPELLPAPAIERTEVTRLAKAAALIHSSSARWLQQKEGSTPKWEKFLQLGRKIAEVQAEGRRNPTQAKNLMALAITYLGPPDWVRRRCATFHENQCDAVLGGAAGAEEQRKARLTSHELTWFNGPCRAITLIFYRNVFYREAGTPIPINLGAGTWALLAQPSRGDLSVCVDAGFVRAPNQYPIDFYSCRLRPGRTGCDLGHVFPDQSAPDGSSKTVVDPKSAQQAGPNQTAKDPVPPATDKSEATRAGTQEPSAKVEGTATDEKGVFDKGTLTAPGAPTDVDTAPAKFSARTAADDALPIAAYTLKHLSADQRRTILEAVRNERSAGPTPNGDFASVGAQVPTAVALSALSPLPDAVTSSMPEMSAVMFTRVAEKIVLINPRTRVVIGVVEP